MTRTIEHLEDYGVTLEEQHLTNGSHVYNLRISEGFLACISLMDAYALMEAIKEHCV